MDKFSLISIVIPVYNCDQLLERCLLSVKDQSYENFEVLIINDGSLDGSEQICLKFSQSDPRFKYYYKENGGVSSARNLGLKKANGRYLTFVDSDDYVDSDYLLNLVSKIRQGSLVQCSFKKISGYTIEPVICTEREFTTSTKIEILDHIRGFCCSKMFDMDIIRRYDIKFDREITLAEDLCFILEYLRYVNEVTFAPETDYNYIIHHSSSSGRLHRPLSLFKAWNVKYSLINDFIKRDRNSPIFIKWKNYIVRNVFDWIISMAVYDMKSPLDSSLVTQLKEKYHYYDRIIEVSDAGSKIKNFILQLIYKRYFRISSLLVYMISLWTRRKYHLK